MEGRDGRGAGWCWPPTSGVQRLEAHAGRWHQVPHRTDRHPQPSLPLRQHRPSMCLLRAVGDSRTEGAGPCLQGFPAHVSTKQKEAGGRGRHRAAREGPAPCSPAGPGVS